jgi:protein TonB
MIAKFATAVPTGAAVTFGLLFVMQALITMQTGTPDVSQPAFPTDWHYVDAPDDLNIKDFEIPDLNAIEPAPEQRPETDVFDSGERIGVPHSSTPPRDPGTRMSNPFTNDGPLMVMVRVQPDYPPVAVQRGLEGFVVVRFDVTSSGTVSNVAVVESSNAIFERAAIATARNFRFKARVVDGVPLTSTGVQYQFRFELED